MFKVMIVDDESRTCNGLVKIIPWDIYGFVVVGTAKNGHDALEKFNTLLPDVLIVDIKMPNMSGLELIERIRSKSPSTRFIILSGYADFAYAKKAILLNVEGYLLKPVDEDELIYFLNSMKEKFNKELNYTQAKQRIDEEKKEKVIHAALSGDYSKVKPYKHYFNFPSYRVLLIKKNSEIREGLELIKELFGKHNDGIVFNTTPYTGVIVNNQQSLPILKQKIEKLLLTGLPKQSDFFAVLGGAIVNIEDLPKSYNDALDLMEKRFFLKEERILSSDSTSVFINDNDIDKMYEKPIELNSITDKLFYSIEIEDKDALERICVETLAQMVALNYSEVTIKRSCIELLSNIQNKVLHSYNDREVINYVYTSKIINIEKQENIEKVLRFMQDLLLEILKNVDMDTSDNLVKKMVNLIERNYSQNIKLDTIAEVLNYNSAYIGQLFKDHTGDYFNTYLDKVRIENAKKLLLEEMKIYKVAEKIGYSNVDYFHSKFKKYEGVSPSVFRKNNRKD
ncbi:response regulator transcription factor [Saliterribacillus persicus]|uniref:AraC family two component transcriptional regulator n=1 Tax=Saliterribacillus persicus TaxID=930114 RepID=A0A368YBS9_9BACI|nr:response regulator transcription factor [Saliterribacillus persicus]RCW76888.1 AraC family two component transcriptional regulator [Saliterribacillus persicus]